MTAPRQTEPCPQHGDYSPLVRTVNMGGGIEGVYRCPTGGHEFNATPPTLHPDERKRLDALTPEELKQEARDAYASALAMEGEK